MMAGIPAVLFLIEAEEREIDDPEEVEPLRIDAELALGDQDLGAVKSNPTENFTGVEPLVGREQDQVAFLDIELLCESGSFGVVEEFDDGRFPFAAFDFDKGEPLGAKTLRVFGHGLD